MIGIVGGTGEIGSECWNLLNRYKDTPVKIGSRNKEHLDGEENKIWEYIDIYDRDSCFQFAKGCKCMINCTNMRGPEIYNLIEAAKNCHVCYIDVNDYENHEELGKFHTTIYYGVGASPGLTEVLPRLIANQAAPITELKLYYATSGTFTQSAAKEFE